MPTDFYWTMDGDIAVDKRGDIRDTSSDFARSYFQEVRTRCMSSFNDWAIHPSMGANLDELLGKLNNMATAEEGKNRIIASLVYGGFLRKQQINVRYIPISKDELVYFIKVTIPIPETGTSQILGLQIAYDTSEGNMRVF